MKAYTKSMYDQFEAQIAKIEQVDESYTKEKLRELLREASDNIRSQLILLQTQEMRGDVFGRADLQDISEIAENGEQSTDHGMPTNPSGIAMEEDTMSFLGEDVQSDMAVENEPNNGDAAGEDENQMLSDSQDD